MSVFFGSSGMLNTTWNSNDLQALLSCFTCHYYCVPVKAWRNSALELVSHVWFKRTDLQNTGGDFVSGL